ncbi:glutamyl-tRNA(Gln) amidotransferase subunit A [Achlya hypogyna]|uniref:Glutamyl-tRNA(Gln) amidotransferase subunit A n=1 Tax=Achlya hypogyna TaxID=1202772 RepID=A0A0A7CP24_ACHHY|nr:secreted protein [Achlya hypogyna]OQR97281.1 glutamyl-tRNA(Gln) amidotransferase subunit A [Achlya hypogyna]
MQWTSAIAVAFVAVLVVVTREEIISSPADIAAKFPGNTMDLRSVKSPRLTGAALRFVGQLVRVPVVGPIVAKMLKADNGFIEVREFASTVPDAPIYYPVHILSAEERATHETKARGIALDELRFAPVGENLPFHRWSIQDYTDAYKAGTVTPLQVARAVLAAIEDSDAGDVPLRAFIQVRKDEVLAEASASTTRYAAGKPLGVLDGVPIAVKDEVDVKGYESSYGTSFLGALNGPAKNDAIAVARLRAAGALFVGKTNMHECGLGTTGINPYHGTVRNPYNAQHMTGGSSSGSAAAVAAGIVPAAIAVDGGGSTRIPAGLCGVVGLKASYQRIPCHFPAAPSLAYVGPITATVADAARMYAVLAGAEEGVPMSQLQPPVHLDPAVIEDTNLKGLRVGIYRDYLVGSDDEIVTAFWATARHLESLGAKLVDVVLPNLQSIHFSHAITILSEEATNADALYNSIGSYSPEVQINYQLGRSVLTAMDVLAAQRVRGYGMRVVAEVFKSVDVLLTPTSGTTAPTLAPDVFESGLSDLSLTIALMRYILVGNFLGLPSITVPAAYTKDHHLPISMLVQGFHYNENELVHLARVIEKFAPPAKPASFYYSILDDAKLL